MLETLISSRIRRTLLEHILAHPDDRFYLRGLAKTLSLSVSPVRRELLRLEQLGMLTAYEEGNMRFYVVNQACPEFLQLKQAAQSTGVDTISAGLSMIDSEFTPAARPVAVQTVAARQQPAIESSERLAQTRQALRILHWRLVFGGLALVSLLVALFGSIVYFSVPEPTPPRRLTTLSVKRSEPAATQSSASGEMRSSRWRLTPGTIGSGWSQ